MKEVSPNLPKNISSPSSSNQIGGNSQVNIAVRIGSGSNVVQPHNKMLPSQHHKESTANVIASAKSDLNIVSIYFHRYWYVCVIELNQNPRLENAN